MLACQLSREEETGLEGAWEWQVKRLWPNHPAPPSPVPTPLWLLLASIRLPMLISTLLHVSAASSLWLTPEEDSFVKGRFSLAHGFRALCPQHTILFLVLWWSAEWRRDILCQNCWPSWLQWIRGEPQEGVRKKDLSPQHHSPQLGTVSKSFYHFPQIGP